MWKRLDLFPLYEINEKSDIRRISNQKILKQQTNIKSGYKTVTLYYYDENQNRKRKVCYVHRLVAQYFCEGYQEDLDVNHKDGDKENNFYKNLEWCSRRENLKHSYQILKRAPNIPKESQKRVAKIFNGKVICTYNSIAEAAKENDTSFQNISACINKRQMTAKGFSWEVIE